MMENKVELIGHYGSDEVIACSAWTSTSRKLDEDKRNRIPKLINMLWKNGHETPFEKATVHFLVDTDIASHIHLLKHRISSLNAECLDGDTMISFENINGDVSKKIKIRDLYERWTHGRKHQKTQKDAGYSKSRIQKMRVRVMNENNGTLETSHIKDIWKTDKKHVYKITLRNGKTIKCSDNHPIFTQEGYKSIKDGLSVGDMTACNGVNTHIKNRDWTFPEFFENSESYTRMEFARLKNIGYPLCKKWGYVFNAKFKEDVNKNFKKGEKPWNFGKTGTYTLNISEAGLQAKRSKIKRGEDSHFWRGGISGERDKIGAWTTQNAPKVHAKYNYTCQKCRSKGQGRLDVHHIVPVCQDENKAYDFDNLVTLCCRCHKHIHRSLESELNFARNFLKSDIIFSYDKKLNRYVSSSKMVYYSDVVNIEYVGEYECYDLEIEGEFKNFVANGIVTHNSARYKELKDDKFYIPEDWKEINCNNINLSSVFVESFDWLNGESWATILENYTKLGNELYHQCLKDLEPILGRKRAKESARFFKTYNSQIQADVMFNMRSFANFLKLRYSNHAQKEIRDIAKKMYEQVKSIEGNPFKHTLNTWEENKVIE